MLDMASAGAAIRWRHYLDTLLDNVKLASMVDENVWQEKVKGRCLEALQPAIQRLHDLFCPFNSFARSVTPADFKAALCM
jgi:hypothetical protein